MLMFMLAREAGYATEMARFFKTNLYGLQNQLDRLETGGVVVSRKVGRTRVYTFNPSYAFLDELKGFRVGSRRRILEIPVWFAKPDDFDYLCNGVGFRVELVKAWGKICCARLSLHLIEEGGKNEPAPGRIGKFYLEPAVRPTGDHSPGSKLPMMDNLTDPIAGYGS